MKPAPIERAVSFVLSALVPAAAGVVLLLTLTMDGGSGSGQHAGSGEGLVTFDLPALDQHAAPARKSAPPATGGKATPVQVPLPIGTSRSGLRPPPAGSRGQALAKSDPVADEQGEVSADPTGAGAISFRDALLAHVIRHRRYPPEAQRQGVQGAVEVRFLLDRSGGVHEPWIVASSGRVILDEEALATIRRAAPMPRIPPGLPDPLEISLPIDFAIG